MQSESIGPRLSTKLSIVVRAVFTYTDATWPAESTLFFTGSLKRLSTPVLNMRTANTKTHIGGIATEQENKVTTCLWSLLPACFCKWNALRTDLKIKILTVERANMSMKNRQNSSDRLDEPFETAKTIPVVMHETAVKTMSASRALRLCFL
jgi:hypothetical protein